MSCIYSNKQLYYVSKLEMQEFFNSQGYKAYEYCISNSNENNIFKFYLSDMEEVMSFWGKKDICGGFINLTLIF